MKIESYKIVLHNLRSNLDHINSLYSCVLFDYKDGKPIKCEDLIDLKKALRLFEDNLQTLVHAAPKESAPLTKVEVHKTQQLINVSLVIIDRAVRPDFVDKSNSIKQCIDLNPWCTNRFK